MHPKSQGYKSIVFFFLIFFLILNACSGPSDDAPATVSPKAAKKIDTPVTPGSDKPDASAPETPAAAVDKNENTFEIIPMESSIYDTHTRGIVLFTHEKHYKSYQIGCGECHHDSQGNPINDLEPSDLSHGCDTCHSNPGKPPKPADGKVLSLAERLVYHSEALHENCINCHKAYNTKTGEKSAPTSCAGCHPKKA